jgi:ribosome-associated translation inhibitor RaiA
MATKIEFRSGLDGRAVRAQFARRLADTIAASPVPPTSARATFEDENGPKGGRAIRCALEVRLPRRPVIHVEVVGATVRLAFDGALAKLDRQIDRLIDTGRALKRRPKKYYAARRALTS